jgi:hypothetical protein
MTAAGGNQASRPRRAAQAPPADPTAITGSAHCFSDEDQQCEPRRSTAASRETRQRRPALEVLLGSGPSVDVARFSMCGRRSSLKVAWVLERAGGSESPYRIGFDGNEWEQPGEQGRRDGTPALRTCGRRRATRSPGWVTGFDYVPVRN